MTDDSNDKFYCSFVNFKDNNMLAYGEVNIQYVVSECGETFPSEDNLKTHLENEHTHKEEIQEYQCGVCSQIYPTEQECIDHYEQTHMSIKLEHNYVADQEYEKEDTKFEPDYTSYIDSDYVQDTCEVVTEEAPDLVQTMLEKAHTLSETKVKRQRPRKSYNAKNIDCEVCGKTCASNASLICHMRVHTGERPYKCNMCDRAFAMPLFLQIHTRTHTGERPYQCQVCPKAFSSRTALLRHDRVHTGIKPYQCPQCGKAFSQSNSRKLHINTVHLKMPAPYKSKSRRLKAKEKEAETVRKFQMDGKSEDNSTFVEVEENETSDSGVTYRFVYDDE